jgi:hypothetical protein
MSLRGFNLGTTRQLLSPGEQMDLEAIRGKIACILADCGFTEAAGECERRAGGCESGQRRVDTEAIVRAVIQAMKPQ